MSIIQCKNCGKKYSDNVSSCPFCEGQSKGKLRKMFDWRAPNDNDNLKKCKECGNSVSPKAKACPNCGAPVAKKTSPITWFVLIIFIVIFWGAISGETPKGTSTSSTSTSLNIAERYPGPWVRDVHPGIARVLVKNDVRGCGEFKYRESSQNKNEFIVRCSRDGNIWQTYLVWVGADKIMGPYTPDSTMD